MPGAVCTRHGCPCPEPTETPSIRAMRYSNESAGSLAAKTVQAQVASTPRKKATRSCNDLWLRDMPGLGGDAGCDCFIVEALLQRSCGRMLCSSYLGPTMPVTSPRTALRSACDRHPAAGTGRSGRQTMV